MSSAETRGTTGRLKMTVSVASEAIPVASGAGSTWETSRKPIVRSFSANGSASGSPAALSAVASIVIVYSVARWRGSLGVKRSVDSSTASRSPATSGAMLNAAWTVVMSIG